MNGRSICRVSSWAAGVSGLLLFLFLHHEAPALDWDSRSIALGTNAGKSCAVGVDRAGRIHTVHSSETTTDKVLTYSMRPTPAEGFTTVIPLSSSADPDSAAAHVDIDITADFTVQIAVATVGGALLVYEKTASFPGFTQTLARSGVAMGSANGGVSLVAAGNGMSFASIAYTGSDGSLKFIEKGAGGWSSAASVTSGSNTGLAPALIDTFGGLIVPNPLNKAIFSYNDATDQIQASYFSLISGTWLAPENVAPAPVFTRPDADVHLGKQGVSYTLNHGSGETRTRQVRFAEGSSGSWTLRTVATSDEMESDFDFFGTTTGMRFDAAGNARVAYKRDSFPILALFTRDIRVRHFNPATGWERTIVDTFVSRYTQDLDLAANEAGDPALVHDLDPGAEDSVFSLARPVSEPWVVPATPLTSFGHTFAPGLATGPDGTVYLAAGVANQAGIFDPRTYLSPRLFAFRGNQVDTVNLGSSSNPHVANAVTVTPDGVVHVVSLRVTTTSSTTGDLLYFRVVNGLVADVTAVDDGGVDTNFADRGVLRLGANADGRLYLAFTRSAGGTAILTLPPGSTLGPGQRPWEQFANVGITSPGYDLVVRPDDGVVLAYYLAGPRTIRCYANVDLVTGAKNATFADGLYATLAVGTPAPPNVACSLTSAGVPKIAYCNDGAIRYLSRSGSATTAHILADGYPDSWVDFTTAGGISNIIAQSPVDGGSLFNHSFEEAAPSTPLSSGRFGTPGIGFSALGGEMVATADASGFPFVATGLLSGGAPLFLFFDDVMVCRPADALDGDGDGVPLLLENAHMMASNFPDAHHLPDPYFINDLEIGFTIRTPLVNSVNFPALHRRQHGEFLYAMKRSNDLRVFMSPDAGTSLQGSASTEVAPGVRSSNLGLNFSPAFRTTRPRNFVRLQVTRVR
jgi:hypothetical protein